MFGGAETCNLWSEQNLLAFLLGEMEICIVIEQNLLQWVSDLW